MNTLIRKLFLRHSYFTIAIRRRTSGSILEDPVFRPDHVLPAEVGEWSADPILAESDGRTWLFYEAVEKNRGRIEVAEVLPDCSLGSPTVLLRGDSHYSYPFVFQWKGIWYMIPESSEAGELRLYRADAFPMKWSLQEVLLRERAVDTTVYERGGSLFLLTFLSDGSSERVTPMAYTLDLQQSPAALRPLEWAQFDSLKVRGAGPVFSENGALYRPVQISRADRYGDAIAVYRLEDSLTAHAETPVRTLKTPSGKQGGVYVDGAHTYCRSSQFEAVDLRCGDFDFWKLPRKLLRRLRK